MSSIENCKNCFLRFAQEHNIIKQVGAGGAKHIYSGNKFLGSRLIGIIEKEMKWKTFRIFFKVLR